MNIILFSTISIILFIALRKNKDPMERANVVNNVHEKATNAKTIAIDATKINNAVLKRLISEIDFDRQNQINSYNRTHNRHNRGR
jgi:hypothetical protein